MTEEKTEQQLEVLLSCFEKLAKINVNEHAEKKGKFTYLSWAWAVDVLRKAEPTATWEVIRFNGLPFLKTEAGFFVEVAVTVQGITLSQLHPVLDNNNRPIATPNAFQINTSIQRCLVKAIALHGLGLYIYAGEDLPEGEPKPEEPKEPTKNAFGLTNEGDLATGEDMKEMQKKMNQDDFAGLKAIIENCGGIEELQTVWMDKKNVAIVNKLKKYEPTLHDLLIQAKDAMKYEFIPLAERAELTPKGE